MAENPTRTVDRALSLLATVCNDGPLTLADAARAAGLSASTALRLLRTLEAQEFVRRSDDGRYAAGARMIQLGARALSNDSLVSLAESALARVVAQTGESTYLAVRGAGDTALYVAIVEGTHSIRHASWVGRTIPLHGSAAGAVLAGETGLEGYVVVTQGVEDDITAIAAPVVVGGRVVASLSVVVPSYRTTAAKTAEIGRLLLVESRSIGAVSDLEGERTT
ncbi:IclR family transcriptional regulator [Microbacterium sp. AG157]|uniref:IclR family transcriptional regulator n=1 Tax=Microbacterium TaxID=33882 RepID=UPI000CCF0DEA|nr:MULTISPECIES: helix-turn-helix domain-containing protein [Microbacterium]PNW09194.1 transcriptional regulator [Microbacterium testaceum]REC97763.1 IclR family transcriptional regulator [Microbacterium sp. AG157]